MDIKFVLKENTRFAVILTLELESYCQAYDTLKNRQRLLMSLKEEQNAAAEISRAEEDFNEASNTLNELHQELAQNLCQFYGDLHWAKIKQLFRTQCDLENPTETQLAHALDESTETASLPLAVECLDVRFIELLKNSIDACLIQYFKEESTETLLQMEISLSLEDEMISILINDNCGGFSEEFLRDFLIKKSADHSSKHDFKEYCFGGNGLGLITLAEFILEGKSDEHSRYAINPGTTQFLLANNVAMNGAEITIKTPLKPFPSALCEDETTVELSLPRARGCRKRFFSEDETKSQEPPTKSAKLK